MKKIIFILCAVFTLQSCSSTAQEKKELKTKSKEMAYKVTKTEAQWKAELTDNEYYILRQKGTERPGTGKYNLHFDKGTYSCKGCNAQLFESNSKFDAHCGWPSFDESIEGTVEYKTDNSIGMKRTEILCTNCGGHLGHIFNDGPTDTGKRYCVNSASINFSEEESKKEEKK